MRYIYSFKYLALTFSDNDHLNKHVGTFEFLHGIGLVKPDDHSTNSAADNSSA